MLIDNNLWGVVNNWVDQLEEETFIQVLPLLRRTFSNFSSPERRKLGEKVKSGSSHTVIKTAAQFDNERGKKGIDVVMKLMGY